MGTLIITIPASIGRAGVYSWTLVYTMYNVYSPWDGMEIVQEGDREREVERRGRKRR